MIKYKYVLILKLEAKLKFKNCYMNYLKTLIKQGKITPAMARLIEISMYSLIWYVLSVSMWQEPFSMQTLINTWLAPLLAYINKYKRDLKK